MRLPELKPIPSRVTQLDVFNGINDNVFIPEGYFKDMKNMSSDYYPALGQRAVRDKYTLNGNINGAVELNGNLYTVIGTKLYKNNAEVSGYTLSDSRKKLLIYGAYIAIFPDNVLYNTEWKSGDEGQQWTKMSYTKSPEDKTSIDNSALPYMYLSDEDGNPYAVMPYTFSLNHGTKPTDVQVKKFVNGLDNFIPAYVGNHVKNVNVLHGAQWQVKHYGSDNCKYPVGAIYFNSNKKLSIGYWNNMMSAWTCPDLYITWWWRTGEGNAKDLEKAIRPGDFIKLEVTASDKKSKLKETDTYNARWKLYNHFSNNYVKVEKIKTGKREDGTYDVGIVFKETGVEYLNYLSKENNKDYFTFEYCDIDDNEANPGQEIKLVNAIKSTTPKILRTPYPWGTSNKTGYMYGYNHLTIKKDLPEMDFVTVCDNRIWGCSNKEHEIYACKLGDPTSWYVYAGLSSDSYAVTIGSEGKFTAAYTYKGTPYFFKENMIIAVYGNRPGNYQIGEILCSGVEAGSEDSISYLDGYLYFKTRQGVVKFNGSSTGLISEELGKKVFKNAKACAGDSKYFISMTENTVNRLFVYDSKKELWHIEDNLLPDFFFKYGTSVFAVRRTAKEIYRIDGLDNLSGRLPGATKALEIPDYETVGDIKLYNRGVNWYAETGKIESGSVNTKYIQRLRIRYELDERAVLTVKVRYDNEDDWMEVYTREGRKNEGIVSIAFRPRRCEKFRLRLEGEGRCLIHNVQRIVNEGSDMTHGNF